MATKILIRYIGGSSGRFLGLLIKSFTVPVKLINPYFAHRNSEIFRHSTMTKINDSDDLYKYSGYHLTKVSSEDAVKWWKENLKFDESSDIIVADSHIPDPKYLLKAHPDVKLINVVFNESDIDQICYNFVTKLKTDELFDFTKMTKLFCKLLNVDWQVDINDIKLISWMFKYSNEKFDIPKMFMDVAQSCTTEHINVEFSDIASKRIIDKLDFIANFVGVTLTDERRKNAIELVEIYANAQITVHWPLLPDDYNLKRKSLS